MEATQMDNDTRGWVMCIVSGVACVLGASVICVDILIRKIPSQRNFRIQDSNAFLASSLSLSFGVMIFMALYSMLPSAKKYLKTGGFDDQPAGFVLMGCFIGGFVGIQIISRLFHQLLPSHVVDCDHTHDEDAVESHANGRSRRQSSRARSHRHSSHGSATPRKQLAGLDGATESTPLLPTEAPNNGHVHAPKRAVSTASDASTRIPPVRSSRTVPPERRPSMVQVQKRVMSFVKDTKANCDELGPCFGYTDPCGQECFKHLGSRSALASRTPTFMRSATGTFHHSHPEFEQVPEDEETTATVSPATRSDYTSRTNSRSREHDHYHEDGDDDEGDECCDQMSEDLEAQHHHHVPTNAFMSIGLQTSIAIALHKFPEGFVTFATNHANPSLGFNVFLALFVHNISEGFAMALPLYMALNSRFRAMVWASILGGLSQPLGAGIAVLWFKLAHRTHMTPNDVAYGCLFAITAGIMASVALQLFVESLSLNHNRNLSILFAFLGMSLLGISNAFTSEH